MENLSRKIVNNFERKLRKIHKKSKNIYKKIRKNSENFDNLYKKFSLIFKINFGNYFQENFAEKPYKNFYENFLKKNFPHTKKIFSILFFFLASS